MQALNLKNNLVLLEISLQKVPDLLANVSEDFDRYSAGQCAWTQCVVRVLWLGVCFPAI